MQAETRHGPGGGLPSADFAGWLAAMSSNQPELILFDAAGTLIQPAEPVERVYQRVFAKFGWATDAGELKRGFRKTFGELGDPDFSAGDGDAAERAWWREVVARTAASGGIDPATEGFEECFEELFSYYATGAAWAVFPEVRGVLEKLRSMEIRMAVVSNFDRRLHQVMEELELAPHFNAILTSADVSARKPSPRLLEVAMSRFSQSPATTRLVGDSRSADGGAAEAAGVAVYVLDRPQTTLTDFLKWLA
jgi:putative hydrolase of the HAD superfamily